MSSISEQLCADVAYLLCIDMFLGYVSSGDRKYCLVMEEGIKKPPLNGGVSQVIPITRHFGKCSASSQVCVADPPDVVD